MKRFRPYVKLMKFSIITDHASLKWLMSLKDLSGRLALWSLQIQAYDFSIEHRKGSEKVVADTLSLLSRLPSDSELIIEDIDMETTAVHSEEYTELRHTILKNKDMLPDLKVEDNKIYVRYKNFEPDIVEFKWKLWIPLDITNVLIEKAYNYKNTVHEAINKTLNRLRTFYYWPNMISHVRQYVRNCDICKETKSSNQHMNPTIGSEVITERPFRT